MSIRKKITNDEFNKIIQLAAMAYKSKNKERKDEYMEKYGAAFLSADHLEYYNQAMQTSGSDSLYNFRASLIGDIRRHYPETRLYAYNYASEPRISHSEGVQTFFKTSSVRAPLVATSLTGLAGFMILTGILFLPAFYTSIPILTTAIILCAIAFITGMSAALVPDKKGPDCFEPEEQDLALATP